MKDKEKGTNIEKPTKGIMELNILYSIEEGETPCQDFDWTLTDINLTYFI